MKSLPRQNLHHGQHHPRCLIETGLRWCGPAAEVLLPAGSIRCHLHCGSCGKNDSHRPLSLAKLQHPHGQPGSDGPVQTSPACPFWPTATATGARGCSWPFTCGLCETRLPLKPVRRHPLPDMPGHPALAAWECARSPRCSSDKQLPAFDLTAAANFSCLDFGNRAPESKAIVYWISASPSGGTHVLHWYRAKVGKRAEHESTGCRMKAQCLCMHF